jgi:hypothetical protein
VVILLFIFFYLLETFTHSPASQGSRSSKFVFHSQPSSGTSMMNHGAMGTSMMGGTPTRQVHTAMSGMGAMPTGGMMQTGTGLGGMGATAAKTGSITANMTPQQIGMYSQTCIKRSPLGHRKSGLTRQVTS